jgi:hypothetical protein
MLVLRDFTEIMEVILVSEIMEQRWEAYQKDFAYAGDIKFEEICDIIIEMMKVMFKR